MMERSVAVQEVKFMRLDTDLIRFVAAVSIVLGHCFLMYLDLACPIYGLFLGAPAIYGAVDSVAVHWALPVFVSILGCGYYDARPTHSQ